MSVKAGMSQEDYDEVIGKVKEKLSTFFEAYEDDLPSYFAAHHANRHLVEIVGNKDKTDEQKLEELNFLGENVW